MIPVDWFHAPLPAKPPAGSGPEQWENYRDLSKKTRLSAVGVQRLEHIRAWLDGHGAQERPLWAAVDGSFTNATVLKALPKNTTLVGRIRADAKLHHLPEQHSHKGRHCTYGRQAPTPEQLRQDENVPWQNIEVFFAGTVRQLRVKQLTPLRWRKAGEHHNLQVIVIAPTPYKVTKNNKWMYRKRAYLICTDPDAPIAQVVQRYIWRWDIEVNHRDEKTLLGVGDAQVRTPNAVQNVTGAAVAASAMLLTAAAKCQQHNDPCQHLPAPKWQRKKSCRPTTMKLIQILRYELWARSIHFSAFMIQKGINTKCQKTIFAPVSAMLYAARYS